MSLERRGSARAKSSPRDHISVLHQKIEDRLARCFDDAPAASRLVCAARHGLLSPGKRFRPIITLLAYAQCGGDADAALDAACAVEMAHAASLIMDDLPCMDNARLRRGRVATHIVFGEGTGMLAAVALLNEAYRLIAEGSAGGAEQKIRAVRHLSAAIGPNGLAGGQERDITCCGGASTLGEMEQRHFEKTGALFAAAAAIGGELAGAAPATVERLSDYGTALGLAYQAFDDVVDARCSAETAGKDVQQDQSKATVVSLLGPEGARCAAQRWLDRAVSAAEAAGAVDEPLLADLARRIGERLGAMTT